MANEYAASRQVRAYARESTYGTAVTPSVWPGLVQDFTDNSEVNIAEVRAGNAMEVNQLVNLQHDMKGSLSLILQDGQLLSNAFNARSTTGSPNYSHTYTWNDASGALPSITLANDLQGTINTQVRFDGVKLGKVTLSCDVSDLLKMDCDWTGAKLTVGSVTSAATPTTSTTAPYTYAGATMSIGGSVITNVTNAQATITTNLEPQHYQASGTTAVVITALPESSRMYEGSFTINPDNSRQVEQFLGYVGATTNINAGSKFNTQMIWRRIGAATETVTVTMSGCRFTSAKLSGGLDGIVSQELPFKAERCTITVVDLISGTGLH